MDEFDCHMTTQCPNREVHREPRPFLVEYNAFFQMVGSCDDCDDSGLGAFFLNGLCERLINQLE